MARSEASAELTALRLSDSERTSAPRAAQQLDLDVLLDEAAHATAGG